MRLEGPVREAWIVEDAGATTALTVEMYDVDPASKTFAEFTGSFGFPYIVSGLKTVVETGENGDVLVAKWQGGVDNCR